MVNTKTLWLDEVRVGEIGDEGKASFISVVPNDFMLDLRAQSQVLVAG
jgi:hypothetical protein